MRTPPRDFTGISLLIFAAVLAAWTSIAGPVFSERSAMAFWKIVERWQTLISALIALAAAYAAARPVYRQLAEQRRQSAAAAVSMIVKAAVALEAERNVVRKMRDETYKARGLLLKYDEYSWHDIYVSWPNETFQFIDVCDAVLRDMTLYRERNLEGAPTQHARTSAIDALSELKKTLNDLITVMRQKTSGLDYEEGEKDLSKTEQKQARLDADVKIEQWKNASGTLDEMLSLEVGRVWTRIRELEGIAVGEDRSR